MHAFAIVGLGKMGAAFALQALGKGLRVVGYTLGAPPEELIRAGLIPVASLAELAAALPPPRLVLLYIPAGPAVDKTLDDLAAVLSPGDIIGDGGNSYWGDSIRRAARLESVGLHFLDIGSSGGPVGAREGACFMVGGKPEAVDRVADLLQTLAVPGGFIRTGAVGTGHFVKLVHNGIEFGMLQAIGEGVALLRAHPQELAIGDILETWRHGSVIRSWLVDLMARMYRETPTLEDVAAYVEDTGEVNWLVDDALHLEVAVPVITQAVIQLVASRDPDHTAARAVAMMRHGFGGHPFGPEEGIAAERHHGRVGGYIAPVKP